MRMLIYKISSISKADIEIRIFRMRPEKKAKQGKLVYGPGQFVIMHLLDEKGMSVDKRPYSIASEPSDDELEFCIKMVGGRFTSKLEKLKKGDLAGIEGPVGHMHAKGNRIALLCGGSGIAPVMSIARSIVKQKRKGEFFIFYSARTKEDIAYHGELVEMQEKNPGIRAIITLTREKPEAWNGACGRIDSDLLSKYIKKPADFEYFICGPMAMALAMKECAIAVGAKEENVHFEGWG